MTINRWGWDTSLDDPPVVLWRIVDDETLEWIRSTMNHAGSASLKPGCICGMDEKRREMIRRGHYSLHGKPGGACARHPKGK